MEKSWSQILNIFQTSIPIPFRHYSGDMSVDNCQTINIFQQITALRSPRARQAAAKPEAQPLNLAQQPRHMLRYL